MENSNAVPPPQSRTSSSGPIVQHQAKRRRSKHSVSQSQTSDPPLINDQNISLFLKGIPEEVSDRILEKFVGSMSIERAVEILIDSGHWRRFSLISTLKLSTHAYRFARIWLGVVNITERLTFLQHVVIEIPVSHREKVEGWVRSLNEKKLKTMSLTYKMGNSELLGPEVEMNQLSETLEVLELSKVSVNFHRGKVVFKSLKVLKLLSVTVIVKEAKNSKLRVEAPYLEDFIYYSKDPCRIINPPDPIRFVVQSGKLSTVNVAGVNDSVVKLELPDSDVIQSVAYDISGSDVKKFFSNVNKFFSNIQARKVVLGYRTTQFIDRMTGSIGLRMTVETITILEIHINRDASIRLGTLASLLKLMPRVQHLLLSEASIKTDEALPILPSPFLTLTRLSILKFNPAAPNEMAAAKSLVRLGTEIKDLYLHIMKDQEEELDRHAGSWGGAVNVHSVHLTDPV